MEGQNQSHQNSMRKTYPISFPSSRCLATSLTILLLPRSVSTEPAT